MSPELSEEMYRRIYRLIKRQIDPRVIANTLNIPLRTVESIIGRFGRTSPDELTSDTGLDSKETTEKGFLDIYNYPKTRYSIIQLVGTLTKEYVNQFNDELEKISATAIKALAIRMSDLSSIDSDGAGVLIKYFEHFHAHGKYFALLDPSSELEASLNTLKVTETIPIFGTERAFEEAAFSHRSPGTIKR
ncbi:MAG: STAS domain-containing protein [Fibrobacter sp.]|mgnify:CR=1 FL=1|nr:STAS domain-containing protein [Fibrobacter sp.]